MREAPPRDADAIAAEAALWTVRLAETRATGQRDPGFERWLAEHPRHRAAFAEASALWGQLGTIRRPQPAPRNGSRAWAAPSRRYVWAAALAACLVLVVGFGRFQAPAHPTYVTVIGEQRSIRLADRTKVVLNTDTEIAVDYDADRRRVVLERGEALFEVAHNPARPFYVDVGGSYVRAVGTTFTVRRDPRGIEVTLLNGKVLVGATANTTAAVALAPGDRLRSTAGAAMAVDRPVLDDVTAWRRGQLVFDATPLVAAVAEMNRYSARPIVLRGAISRGVKLSGVFETGESETFATTVAAIYGLEATKTATGFILRPATPAR